jgi:hypothetical protein
MTREYLSHGRIRERFWIRVRGWTKSHRQWYTREGSARTLQEEVEMRLIGDHQC